MGERVAALFRDTGVPMIASDKKMTNAQLDEWVLDFVRFGGLDVPCDFDVAWLAWRSRGLPEITKAKFRSSLWRLHDEGHIWLDEKGWVYRVTLKSGDRAAISAARAIRLSYKERAAWQGKRGHFSAHLQPQHNLKRGLVIYPSYPKWRDREKGIA